MLKLYGWLQTNLNKFGKLNHIQYMLRSKRKGMCLPYGNLVTTILEHIRFNKNWINNSNNNDVWDHWLKEDWKTSKGKKRKVEDQEALVNLEDFEYDIPQIPLTKDILNIIIINLEKINDNINFQAHHFGLDLGKIPPRLFTDDDFDMKNSLTYVY